MQIAPSSTSATALPTAVQASADVVSPSKLFSIASTRFGSAMGTLGLGGPASAPSAMVTGFAVQDIRSGIAALRSALVPSTPINQWQRGSAALAFAREGIDLLEQYRAMMEPMGDGPLRRSELAPGVLDLIDQAHARLRSAITRLA